MKQLEPIKELTPDLYKKIIVVEDFHQAVRLEFVGRYFRVEATDKCPTLYYLYIPEVDDYQIYAIDNDLIEFNTMKSINKTEPNEEVTEAPTEVITEEPTEAPTEEVTEEPTEEPNEDETPVESEESTEEVVEDTTEGSESEK